jgi:hypothetical protein
MLFAGSGLAYELHRRDRIDEWTAVQPARFCCSQLRSSARVPAVEQDTTHPQVSRPSKQLQSLFQFPARRLF